MVLHTTAYGTPQDVFDLLNLQDPVTMEPLSPDNTTYPTYDQLQRRLLGISDDFDAKTHDTWRINTVIDYVFDRGTMWSATNTGIYGTPWRYGGWATQLIGPIMDWDASLGDKLYSRKPRGGEWTDITDQVGTSFWFDYRGGVFFCLYPQYLIDSAFKITYRYGRNDTPPYDVQDAVIKMAAIWVMQSDWYRTKLGGGGDLSSKNDTIRQWREDYNMTVYQHMNCGEAISLLP